jgi:hypothetical protein
MEWQGACQLAVRRKRFANSAAYQFSDETAGKARQSEVIDFYTCIRPIGGDCAISPI